MPIFQLSPRFKLKVEVVDDSSTIVFVLFDRDVNVLLKKTCEDLLKLSFQVPTERGFPDLVGSLIGRRLLFKVETKLNTSLQFEATFPVRRICEDEDIIAMFDLAGGDCTPTKALFTPPFSNVDTSVDLEETFPQQGIESSAHYSPVSLGDDDTSIIPKYTPATRCLDQDFLSCKVGQATKKLKAVDVVDVEAVEEEGQSSCELVPIKIEKYEVLPYVDYVVFLCGSPSDHSSLFVI